MQGYKKMRLRQLCMIFLFSIPEKEFNRILINILSTLAENFLPEAQCGSAQIKKIRTYFICSKKECIKQNICRLHKILRRC